MSANRLTPEQQRTLDTVQSQADKIIYSLNTRFNERLARELKARLDSLKWFLDDCTDDRARCRTNYPFEIRNRQRIEEILKRIGDDLTDEQRTHLREVDRRLEQNTTGRDFIWDESLQAAFPSDRYWYLYRQP